MATEAESVDEARDLTERENFFRRWTRVEGQVVPPRSEWPTLLRRVRLVGFIAIALGFFGLASWSEVLVSRWSETCDFALYNQAWFLIAHGNLNPYSSVFNIPFYKNDLELFMWPAAVLWYVWPHPQTLVWLQDLSSALAEGVLFAWMCELAAVSKRSNKSRFPIALVPVVGLIVLISSPWVLWTSSFDFHPEPLLVLLAACTARALWKGQRRGWLWALATLTGGGIGATYLAGLGLGAIFAGRAWRRSGITLTLGAFAALVGIQRLGGAAGVSAAYERLFSGLNYGVGTAATTTVLRAVVSHPGRLWGSFLHIWVDLYADVASGGFLGFFWPQTLGIIVIVLAENGATGLAGFTMPWVMNSMPIILFGILGTIACCTWLISHERPRLRIAGFLLLLVVLANAIGWAIVWTPKAKSYWLQVTPSAALTLDHAAKIIPGSDEVIANQGIVGRFAYRRWVYALFVPSQFPLQTRTVWFVITPTQGSESQSVGDALAEVAQITSLHAKVIANRDGVFVLKWLHPANEHQIDLNGGNFAQGEAVGVNPAWEFEAASSRPVERGPASTWYEVATSRPGYVVALDYWNERPRRYIATVRLSSTVRVNVEVWDDSIRSLLVRVKVNTHGTLESVRVPYRVTANVNVFHSVFSGYWPFKILQRPALPYDRIEIRVWSPGTGRVRVYYTKISRA